MSDMSVESLRALVEGMITHDDYREKNPEIDQANVFSISTLAYDHMKQFRKKMNLEKASPTNFDMFHGKAIHEYLQNRFRSLGYIDEMKLQYVMPFDWGIEELQNVILIGHVDLWNPADGVLIELKSSLWSDRISDFMIRQAAAYAFILRSMNKTVAHVFIVKVNTSIHVYELTERDIVEGWNEIEERAYTVAKHLRNEILAHNAMVDTSSKHLIVTNGGNGDGEDA